MAARSSDADFVVWGSDKTPYGPVDLATLLAWAQDDRVSPDMWVFIGKTGVWQRAGDMPELKGCFPAQPAPALQAPSSPRGVELRVLRRVKVMADLTDAQLERFAPFVELERIPAQTVIVKQGDRDDTLYMIIEGQLRVRLKVLEKETTLASLGPGDFFGDIAFLDRGPRSADVVADAESLVAKISGTSFDALAKDSMDLATPLLRALDQTLTSRIRADNLRYSDVIKLRRDQGKP